MVAFTMTRYAGLLPRPTTMTREEAQDLLILQSIPSFPPLSLSGLQDANDLNVDAVVEEKEEDDDL